MRGAVALELVSSAPPLSREQGANEQSVVEAIESSRMMVLKFPPGAHVLGITAAALPLWGTLRRPDPRDEHLMCGWVAGRPRASRNLATGNLNRCFHESARSLRPCTVPPVAHLLTPLPAPRRHRRRCGGPVARRLQPGRRLTLASFPDQHPEPARDPGRRRPLRLASSAVERRLRRRLGVPDGRGRLGCVLRQLRQPGLAVGATCDIAVTVYAPSAMRRGGPRSLHRHGVALRATRREPPSPHSTIPGERAPRDPGPARSVPEMDDAACGSRGPRSASRTCRASAVAAGWAVPRSRSPSSSAASGRHDLYRR